MGMSLQWTEHTIPCLPGFSKNYYLTNKKAIRKSSIMNMSFLLLLQLKAEDCGSTDRPPEMFRRSQLK